MPRMQVGTPFYGAPPTDPGQGHIKRPVLNSHPNSYGPAPKHWNQQLNAEARGHWLDNDLSVEEVYTRMKESSPQVAAMDASEVKAHLQNIKTQFGL